MREKIPMYISLYILEEEEIHKHIYIYIWQQENWITKRLLMRKRKHPSALALRIKYGTKRVASCTKHSVDFSLFFFCVYFSVCCYSTLVLSICAYIHTYKECFPSVYPQRMNLILLLLLLISLYTKKRNIRIITLENNKMNYEKKKRKFG